MRTSAATRINLVLLLLASYLAVTQLSRAESTADQDERSAAHAADSEKAASAKTKVRFNRDIRPLLSDRCFQCHGPGTQESGLRLDQQQAAHEWAIVPGEWEESELFARVTSDDPDLRMPPLESKKEPINDEEAAMLKQWINEGAEYEAHWAYVPIASPAVPKVSGEAWARNAIDAFVLARLEQEELRPSMEADRVTLVRRLYLDLIGLPPTLEQIDAYLLDNREDAYEQLVDQLLASPRYAERMATWWFDLVRFADTCGYHGDQDHAILPYRDYVLKAFDENVPFDRFTIEQLAGDLLPETGDESADMWRKIATGYNRVLMTSHEGGIQDKEYRAKMLADRVRNVSEVWMGSSMGCCECHDHKYDPFTAKNFYSMAAFFADVDHHGSFVSVGSNSTPTQRPPEMLAWTLPVSKELQQVDKQIAELEKKLVGKLPKDYKKTLAKLTKLRVKRAELQGQFQATMITSATKPATVRVLPRGNWMDDSGEVVKPNIPTFLKEPASADETLTRLDLANWIVSDENPLTARVVANRLWRLYFGAGISRVMIDVGSQGEAPTHPDLLDWLATDLRTHNWDIKRFIRQMVLSSAYRQSSLPVPALQEIDPENRLLAHQGRYRLQAEQIRDCVLHASGLLVNQLGGVTAKPYQPKGYYAQLNFPTRTYRSSKGDDQYRRGVYTHWQRQYLHPWLLAFDAPSREECTASRSKSNTPGAALVLMNDPSFLEAARNLATRVLTEGPKEDADRVGWAWRTLTSRQPRSEEVESLLELLSKHREQFETDTKAAKQLTSIGHSPIPTEVAVAELAAWTSVCRVLINLSETITRN